MCGESLDTRARSAGVHDPRILAALNIVPRSAFLPATAAAASEKDEALPIGCCETTSQPSLCARMIEALELAGTDTVLEIGTGAGYQTALLSRLANTVVTVEYWPELAETARRSLAAHGADNVTVLCADGGAGAPEHAPFDAILVSAAFPTVPAPLTEQLREGGRLVQPLGPGGAEEVTLFQRRAGRLVRHSNLMRARFVRLHGAHGYG
ncbi:protein-L-isoaspartate(D-aspartate) O-methyltransferase [Lipingzhangella sp. LS1_29]|uniref:Protein-L-isoaspartate O-methyltransferase n=1 Tax=Lipingzhangella rawalii TaxID=2055835 RepID=A0ABU2H2B3_9ACTN|nr:protein-L-isoaspartate(D-aspartate) O-methyltransferase [Lipingzhangella rawalii]MDS1269443.1 protein-L-isoaspartate(D-aspartate) O-methyltransferase [Lipingzhangella rawalii]